MAPLDLHPVATASLPWQLVLAIIVFNIVLGLISKRKQGQGKPGQKGAGNAEDARRRAEEAREKARAEAERKAAEREARARRDPEESGEPAEAEVKREKAKEVGKDLLSQLARELGLELPSPPKPAPPRPVPGPTPAQRPESAPSRTSTARPAARKEALRGGRAAGESEDGEHDGSWADLIASRKASGPEGTEAPADTRAQAVFDPHASPELARSALSPLAGELADAGALRKAFILKTILDKPLALQPRR